MRQSCWAVAELQHRAAPVGARGCRRPGPGSLARTWPSMLPGSKSDGQWQCQVSGPGGPELGAAAGCPAAGRPGHSRLRPVVGVQVYIRARVSYWPQASLGGRARFSGWEGKFQVEK